ncbi:MAG: phasin family protein [Stellaceae bacterium]
MSDEKQPQARRATPAPQIAAEPAGSAPEAAPAAMALPEPEVKPALPAPIPQSPRAADRYFAAYRATLASIGESQVAAASDMTAMAIEMSALARSSLTVAGDSVSALLTARSLVDVVEAQLGFARRSIDAVAGGSTRLGEIGLRLANDAAKRFCGPSSSPSER